MSSPLAPLTPRTTSDRARRLLTASCAGLLLAGAALAALASARPIHAAAWHPPPSPALVGALAANDALVQAERFDLAGARGPETIAADAEGRLYGGTEDGRIVRVTIAADDTTVLRTETFADTGGRPLGLAFDARGTLVVADALRGLLAIDAAGAPTVLATEAAGRPFRFTDDVDVARDGRLYFTDGSARFGFGESRSDALEARGSGRLLRYDPATRATEVLLEGLGFANGVALAPDERFVLVNETYRYRVTRYWLAGPAAGTSDAFADALPGFPDGIAADGADGYWVALYTLRSRLLDRLHPHPRLKDLLAAVPDALLPSPEPYGLVIALGPDGRVRRSLHDPTGARLRSMTSAEPIGPWLYLGTIDGPAIARVPLP